MKTLILPGWYGSGEAHWQRLWLHDEPNAIVVEQPDWAHPDLDTWVANLDAAIEQAAGPVLLVAHSLGVLLALHYSRLRPDAPIAAALLVAPGDVDLHAPNEPVLQSFAPAPREKLSFRAIMVVSQTDPHMSFERSTALGRDIGAELVDIGDAGHINVDSGFGKWPLGHQLAQKLKDRRVL